MAQHIEIIKATKKTESGKGAARKMRDANLVPAVIYGEKKDPVHLALNGHDLMLAIQQGQFYTSVHTLDIEGDKVKVLAKDIQRHPVNSNVMHVDFMNYNAKSQVKVVVGVTIVGEEDAPGLDKGGVLQVVRTEIEVLCRADNIPSEIVISVAGKDVGDSVHLSDANLPDGVESTEDRDFTIASIVSTRTSNTDEDEADDAATAEGAAAEGAEGEEKKDGDSEKKDGEDKPE